MKLLSFAPLSQILTREQDRNLNLSIIEMISGGIARNVASREILNRVDSMESNARHAYMWVNHPNRANWSRF